ncbi:MAG: LLM class F420-dependent oxidoreductase [Chloroflexi bacterium]|nr:LLM class F420-dependent oxidoreductase [Chloroflexota bacterium]
MKIGAIFPQLEIGADPGAIREYVQALEDMGYDHVGIYDHVLGADPGHYTDWRGPYTSRSLFHEPMVLYGYVAAVTTRLELATEIIILPQRQTALLAKQAAEVDVLSGGRLRLGIGIGWNQVEYEGLGQDFRSRGRRSEEQVRLLKALWTQEVVTFEGRWDRVTAAGINPLPVQRPIPVWFGGGEEPVLKRLARLGDGWFPQGRPETPEMQGRVQRMREYAWEAGRDPASIGIEGRAGAANATPEEWARTAAAWRELGATHLSLNTMGAGFKGLPQHLDALRRFKEAVS